MDKTPTANAALERTPGGIKWWRRLSPKKTTKTTISSPIETRHIHHVSIQDVQTLDGAGIRRQLFPNIAQMVWQEIAASTAATTASRSPTRPAAQPPQGPPPSLHRISTSRFIKLDTAQVLPGSTDLPGTTTNGTRQRSRFINTHSRFSSRSSLTRQDSTTSLYEQDEILEVKHLPNADQDNGKIALVRPRRPDGPTPQLRRQCSPENQKTLSKASHKPTNPICTSAYTPSLGQPRRHPQFMATGRAVPITQIVSTQRTSMVRRHHSTTSAASANFAAASTSTKSRMSSRKKTSDTERRALADQLNARKRNAQKGDALKATFERVGFTKIQAKFLMSMPWSGLTEDDAKKINRMSSSNERAETKQGQILHALISFYSKNHVFESKRSLHAQALPDDVHVSRRPSEPDALTISDRVNAMRQILHTLVELEAELHIRFNIFVEKFPTKYHTLLFEHRDEYVWHAIETHVTQRNVIDVALVLRIAEQDIHTKLADKNELELFYEHGFRHDTLCSVKTNKTNTHWKHLRTGTMIRAMEDLQSTHHDQGACFGIGLYMATHPGPYNCKEELLQCVSNGMAAHSIYLAHHREANSKDPITAIPPQLLKPFQLTKKEVPYLVQAHIGGKYRPMKWESSGTKRAQQLADIANRHLKENQFIGLQLQGHIVFLKLIMQGDRPAIIIIDPVNTGVFKLVSAVPMKIEDVDFNAFNMNINYTQKETQKTRKTSFKEFAKSWTSAAYFGLTPLNFVVEFNRAT